MSKALKTASFWSEASGRLAGGGAARRGWSEQSIANEEGSHACLHANQHSMQHSRELES